MSEQDDETSLETYQGWVNDFRPKMRAMVSKDRKLSRKDRTTLLSELAMFHAGDTKHDDLLFAVIVNSPNVSYEDVRAMRRMVMRDVDALREGKGPKVVASLQYAWKLCLFLASCESELKHIGKSWLVKCEDLLLYKALAAK